MSLPASAYSFEKKERTISRDEMNLAEFPLAVLSTRADPHVKTLEFEDIVVSKNGEKIERKWVITSADKFGLPTASDDEVLLGLMKLTVDDGFRATKIHFTRYELLRILKWTTEGRSYSRLQNALDRLSGVRIKATNAFFDNETKSHSTKNFGIIDAYEINDGRDSNPKPSFFIWSEELFHSFQVGFIKKLDLDFLLQLKSAVTKRLFRYLDKHFWYKAKVQISLFTLAHEKIGISRNYKYASSLKQQLEPAIEELLALGFLSKCEYTGQGRGTEIILYASRGKPRVLGNEKNSVEKNSDNENYEVLKSSGTEEMLGKLVARGLREPQARALLLAKQESQVARMSKIIDYFDSLVRSGSHLVSRSPVGFLYRAVEDPDRFVLPGEKRDETIKTQARVAKGQLLDSRQETLTFAVALQSEYCAARQAELHRIRENIETGLEQKLRIEVENSQKKFKGLISEGRYEESVRHGIEEKLLRLFAFPEYAEWVALEKKRSH